MSEELSLREIRLQKLARMKELGHNPYAVESFERTGSASDLLARFEGKTDEELAGETVTFAGRVVSYRLMGKAGFAHLSDGDAKIQVYCRKDDVGETGWELYNLLDIGDHVGVKGFLFRTRTGESSIHVQELTPLSKSLQTLPLGKVREIKDDEGNVVASETWYGLEDVEQRYRHRHLDLIANPEARKTLIDRAKIVSAVRRYFDGAGYLEVETPMLQVVAGGAAARPFKTHYNAYDLDVKMRISLELYLKRLICGDIPAVYEIGRVFRNEGLSNRHNPEFTLLEFYEAFTNLEGMMRRVEEMFAFVAREVYGSTIFKTRVPNKSVQGSIGKSNLGIEAGIEIEQVEAGFDVEMDFSKSWTRLDLVESICAPLQIEAEEFHRNSVDIKQFKPLIKTALKGISMSGQEFAGPVNLEFPHRVRQYDATGDDHFTIRTISGGNTIDLERENTVGGLIEKLLECFVEDYLLEPTFVVGYPIETSPLAKKDPSNERMTRRFEGYILGREICNAFSEINDPIDQKERFEQQASELAKGDDEAHPYDEEFLYALEGGMPPTGGCGIGMERLAMVLTGADHIREVLMFPMMRPN